MKNAQFYSLFTLFGYFFRIPYLIPETLSIFFCLTVKKSSIFGFQFRAVVVVVVFAFAAAAGGAVVVSNKEVQ